MFTSSCLFIIIINTKIIIKYSRIHLQTYPSILISLNCNTSIGGGGGEGYGPTHYPLRQPSDPIHYSQWYTLASGFLKSLSNIVYHLSVHYHWCLIEWSRPTQCSLFTIIYHYTFIDSATAVAFKNQQFSMTCCRYFSWIYFTTIWTYVEHQLLCCLVQIDFYPKVSGSLQVWNGTVGFQAKVSTRIVVSDTPTSWIYFF